MFLCKNCGGKGYIFTQSMEKKWGPSNMCNGLQVLHENYIANPQNWTIWLSINFGLAGFLQEYDPNVGKSIITYRYI